MADKRSELEMLDVEIGTGYPQWQLAKALRNAWATGSDTSKSKATKWQRVLEGMLSGQLNVGSRTPLPHTPPWITLEVVTGGFATGGDLRAHEEDWARGLKIPMDENTRAALNGYFITDEGQERLLSILESGKFAVDTPEEGALLIVAWLLKNDQVSSAQLILDHLLPYFDRLRFFPIPRDIPMTGGAEVYLETASETAKRLRKVSRERQLDAQEQTIQLWTPLYDEAVRLLLLTVDGDAPSVATDASGKPLRTPKGEYRVSGGYPCARKPAGWNEEASALLAEFRKRADAQRPGVRWEDPQEPFQRFLRTIEAFIKEKEIPSSRTEYVRMALGRFIAKRGAPGSEKHRARREAQGQQCAKPRYHEIASLVARRLDALPHTSGIRDVDAAHGAITKDEATPSVPEGTEVPPHLCQKVARAKVATIGELIDEGHITSADVLAEVLPQITSEIRAASLQDPLLRKVYAQVYRAFRKRRSLLLLNLESQVKMEELPWVGELGALRESTLADQELAKSVVTEVVGTALTHFPHAILPNKLLQELRSLTKQAKLNVPIVDEVAADIFMGVFSRKFARAASLVGELLKDSVYARYYGIDYGAVVADADAFSRLCNSRAESSPTRRFSVSANGVVIEQQQILTTQNLATLWQALDLSTVLGPRVRELAESTFRWICRRQQVKLTEPHAAYTVLKNTAYAWRQLVFYVSQLPEPEQRDVVQWMTAHLAKQGFSFGQRFAPVLQGLDNVQQGKDVTTDYGRVFLGWTVQRHWLMPPVEDTAR